MTEKIHELPEMPMQRFSGMDCPENPEYFRELKRATPARIDIGRAGNRCRTGAMLRFRADHAAAADAVFSEVPTDVVQALGLFEVRTCCRDKVEMLTRPDLGRLFDAQAKEMISGRCVRGADVQIYVGDGLCSPSVAANIPDLLPAVTAALTYEGISVGTPFFVRYCRVNTVRTVSELLHPEVTCVLIGERPGLLTSESMSAYISYRATCDMSESNYSVVSNISRAGMPPVEAAAVIADIICAMLVQKTCGSNLVLDSYAGEA